MGVIVQGPRKSYNMEASWSPVGSRLRPLASLCVLMIPNCTLNKSEPKSLNPMSYQVVAHFTQGRKGVPYPSLTNKFRILKVFVFLTCYLNFFTYNCKFIVYLVFDTHDTHAHKTNTDIRIMWHANTQMQTTNKDST